MFKAILRICKRQAMLTFFAVGFCTASASAAEHLSEKYAFLLPPSANLTYVIRATQRGIPIGGQGLLNWHSADNKYTIVSQTKVLFFGTILESRSEGAIDDYGLAPQQFLERSFRREQTTTSFNRAKNSISFSESSEIFPIKGGEQDRTSVTWQLASIARAAPDKFVPGSEWIFFVAGRRDAESWRFKVLKQESILTPMGAVKTLHVSRAPPPDAKDQQLDLWFAPSLEWYPVRLRFSEGDGDFVEQKLEKIERK